MASLVPEAPIALEVQAMSLSTSELEVIQWLESIGYERYQQNFVAADIFSLDVLRAIESSDDLQELGIPKFPAIALMKHIVELKANGFTIPPERSADEASLVARIKVAKEANDCGGVIDAMSEGASNASVAREGCLALTNVRIFAFARDRCNAMILRMMEVLERTTPCHRDTCV